MDNAVARDTSCRVVERPPNAKDNIEAKEGRDDHGPYLTVGHHRTPPDAPQRHADQSSPHHHRPPDPIEMPLQPPDLATRGPSSPSTPFLVAWLHAPRRLDHRDLRDPAAALKSGREPRRCPPQQPHGLCCWLPLAAARWRARAVVAAARVSAASHVA
jgi:hypothetical protein